jgi:hypothetical protein
MNLEELFTEDRARTLCIYEINNLVKRKEKLVLNYSKNTVIPRLTSDHANEFFG